MRVLGLVPARGGSKGIPRKNIAPVAGKPLIAWTLEAAAASRLERIVVSSDNAEIRAVAQRTRRAEVPFVRPAELAEDNTPAIDVILHAITWLREHESYVPDALLLLQPTSPLRTATHINEGLDQYQRLGADSLVSVFQAPHTCVPELLMRLAPPGWLETLVPQNERTHIRQSKPVYYARNGALYLAALPLLLEARTLYGRRLAAYVMPREDSVDVDEPFDLELSAWLLERRASRKSGERGGAACLSK